MNQQIHHDDFEAMSAALDATVDMTTMLLQQALNNIDQYINPCAN